MTHPDAESLIQSFTLTQRVVRLQTDGLIAGRNTAPNLLGQPPVWAEGILARYQSGCEPLDSGERALPLARLLTDLDRPQARIMAALERISTEQLAEVVGSPGSERPLGRVLAGLHWHETYHTDQLALSCQLAGTNDAII